MEIDLTEEQLEKVKQLEAHDIGIGEAIDLLFEAKKETLSLIEDVDETIGLFDKVKQSALDVDDKAEILDENYGDAEKTYEMKVQDVKHKISWTKDIFKF